MIRKVFSLFLIVVLFSSCGNTGSKNTTSEATKVEFESLVENPDNYLNKNIIVEGKVVHVCTMSGKKLFIVGENPDIRLFIAAGDDMPKFPMELLGSEVVVEGTITKVGGEPEMGTGEKHPGGMEVASVSEGSSNSAAGDSCETETALAKQSSLANIVMEYKSHSVK
jgi:hypothetical protein